eukprot:s412_g41.t1
MRSMQLPVRSQRTPREQPQAFAVPAAPPPSPSVPARQRQQISSFETVAPVPSAPSPRGPGACVVSAQMGLQPSMSWDVSSIGCGYGVASPNLGCTTSPLLRVRSVEPPRRQVMVTPQHRTVPRLDLGKARPLNPKTQDPYPLFFQIGCTMPLSVRRSGKQVFSSQDTLEAYQLVDDDLGRLVQWTVGSPQEMWEVRFTFTHVCGPNGGTVLGLGFGTSDVRMDEVDILECENLAVCDAYDGEINVFGQQFQKESLDLCEPSTGACEEESITALYDATKGLLRFTVESRRCRGSFRTEIQKESLRQRELYPTVAFANRRSKVRIELISSLMAKPTPRDERLLRADFSSCLYLASDAGQSDYPSGAVHFAVDGRKLQADKFLLSARSEYFERMLRGGMSEGVALEVPIPRASAPAFEAVLRFIYSAGQAGQVLFEEADPLEVLHLSVEFLLEDLTKLCEWKLMQGLTLDNALITFGSVVSVRSKVPTLVKACVERMQGQLRDVVGSESFKELCRSEVAVRELLLSFDEPLAKRRRAGGVVVD